jgi:ribose 5-phosphate isomerase B
MKNNIIILGADHNGVSQKLSISDSLKSKGFTVIDLGPHDTLKSVDYADYAKQLSQIINSNSSFRGILLCGTGVGMSIAANRYEGVRAALVHNIDTAAKCREHNDSNILCLGSWSNSYDTNQEIVDIWLNESFGEGRHNKRLSKLDNSPQKIIFTNGVFDILHTGHLELLQFSKRLGGRLVVAINSDKSVRKLKGKTRPINNEDNRKKLLESLIEVDEVIIFDGNLKEVRNKISPNIVVKGGEWSADEVRHRDNIPEDVQVNIFPLVQNYSTTDTIRKIQRLDTLENGLYEHPDNEF